jgi:hypothetical protein
MTRIKYRVNYSGDVCVRESAALHVDSETLVKKDPAGGTYYFLLPVQFVKSIGFEHDTFAVSAMGQAEQVPDLMGPFLDDPVNEIVIAPPPAIIFIVQAGGRHNAGTHGFTGKPKNKTVSLPEQVLVNNQEYGLLDPVPVFVGLDAVQQCLGIDLFSYHI